MPKPRNDCEAENPRVCFQYNKNDLSRPAISQQEATQRLKGGRMTLPTEQNQSTAQERHSVEDEQFTSFAQFYPFYLTEHQHPVSRALHYTGSSLVLLLLVYSLYTQHYLLLIGLPLLGYGFAWLGHFGFEKNRPATFKYPIYSFLGDWVMLKDAISGQLKSKL
jgi:hypothetical protein